MIETCRNCGATLEGRFCRACGQDRTLVLRPWRELLAEWSDAVLGWDTRSGRTLRALVREPGRLTLEYAAGRRAGWLHPLRLYLGISVVAFAVFGATNAMVMARTADVVASGGELSLMGVMLLKISAAMLPLLPIAAACYALVFRDRGRYYAEHLVYVIHTTALFLLAHALASLVQGVLVVIEAPEALLVVARLAAHVAVLVYAFAAARRVYGLGRWMTLLRLVAVTALFAPVLGTTLWLMAGRP